MDAVSTPNLESIARCLTLSHRNQPARAIPPAHLRSRLLDLSDGDLVLNIVGNELPLQQDVPSGMDKQQTKQNPDLQRTDRRAGGVGGTGSSGDTRTDLPTAGDVDHHLTPTITPTPSTRPYQAIDRPGGNRDRADGNLTEIPSERIGLHANTEGLDTSIQPSKPIKLENGDELTEEAIQIDTEAPMIALNSEHVDPVEAWKREHPEMLETKLLTGTGKVLHIFADGQWIQNINRGREFSLQPRSNIEIKVGQKVEVAEDGSVKLISGQEKV